MGAEKARSTKNRVPPVFCRPCFTCFLRETF